MKYDKFKQISSNEAIYIVGGVDKNIKDLFYYIGYIIGKIINLFTKRDKSVSSSVAF